MQFKLSSGLSSPRSATINTTAANTMLAAINSTMKLEKAPARTASFTSSVVTE